MYFSFVSDQEVVMVSRDYLLICRIVEILTSR